MCDPGLNQTTGKIWGLTSSPSLSWEPPAVEAAGRGSCAQHASWNGMRVNIPALSQLAEAAGVAPLVWAPMFTGKQIVCACVWAPSPA